MVAGAEPIQLFFNCKKPGTPSKNRNYDRPVNQMDYMTSAKSVHLLSNNASGARWMSKNGFRI